jgi:ParB-like nuclease domain
MMSFFRQLRLVWLLLANLLCLTTGTFASIRGYDAGGDRFIAAKSGPRLTAPAHAFERLEARSLQSPQKIADLTASMKANGWQGDAISVFEHNGSKYILDGHHRVAAARAAGIEVPYNSIPASRLPEFNYKSVDDVIWSAVEAGGR